MNAKQNMFLIKKVVTRFDKKDGDMAENEHWWRKESVIADPKKEDPVSEDSKKTLSLMILKRILSMRNLKRTLITVKPKDNAINEDPQQLQDPQWLLRRKLPLFGFLVKVMIEWMMGINFFLSFVSWFCLFQQSFSNKGNCVKTR